MFLALREIRHSPTRFALIMIVVFLVSYLVYFLTGLAYGLASSYSETVRKWNTHSIVISEDSNKSMLSSRLTQEDVEAVEDEISDATRVLLTPVVFDVTDSEGVESRESAYLFGIDEDAHEAPDVVEGSYPAGDNEILLDQTLANKGFALGDTLYLVNSDTKWTISGFTSSYRFQAAPALFITTPQFADAFNYSLMSANGPIKANALLLNTPPTDAQLDAFADRKLDVLTPDELVAELPGYSAQTLTFSLMIGSLIAIISFVLGIFIYVLTLQKLAIFGIMKAQGVRTSYIVLSGAMQTFVLTGIGVAVGMALAIFTGVLLSPKVPFAVNPMLFALVSSAFMLFTLIGGLTPIRTINKIDPIEAIG
ncbi:MAG: ABC transporter permease [Actinobacteria bacterium]|nr:MAG: ABC transporter permease [Actinomycetota bacterium]